MSEKPPRESPRKVISFKEFKEAGDRKKKQRSAEEEKRFVEGWDAGTPLEGAETFPRQSLYGEGDSVFPAESFSHEDAVAYAEHILNLYFVSEATALLQFREEAELGEDVSDEEVATMYENKRQAGHHYLELIKEPLSTLKQYLENDFKKEGEQVSRPRILAVAERYLALLKGG